MDRGMTSRRGFLGRLAAVCGGLAAVPMLSRPAHARSHRRGGWGGGRWSSGRRFWGGYGYGGYGYPGGFYSRGYYGIPYGGGYYGGYYSAPAYPNYGGWGGYGGYGGYNYYPPMLKREAPKAIDAFKLLEC